MWTLLLDVGNEQVKPPLGQFQHTSADRHDFFRIVQSINSGSGKPRSDADLKEVFEAIWPTRLGPCIDRLRKQGPTEKKEGRSSEEILAEVLESVRKMDRRYSH